MKINYSRYWDLVFLFLISSELSVLKFYTQYRLEEKKDEVEKLIQ